MENNGENPRPRSKRQRPATDAAEEAAFFEYATIECNGYGKMCNGNVIHLMRPKRQIDAEAAHDADRVATATRSGYGIMFVKR